MPVPGRSALSAAIAALLTACGPKPAPRPPPVPMVAVASIDDAAPGARLADGERPETIEGLGPLLIGQPIDDVRRILGPEARLATPEDEARDWSSAGYDPDKGLVFLVGFDALLVYEAPSPNVDYPFWKIYAKNGRVVFIILTAFGFEGLPSLGRVGFAPSCFLNAESAAIEPSLGKDYLPQADEERGHVIYHYLDRGLSVISVNGVVRVFNIYGALDPAVQAKFKKAIAAGPAAPPP